MKTFNSLQKWRAQVFRSYANMKKHKRPYQINLNGLDILVLPNVFSPKYFTDSLWFTKEVNKIVGTKSLLDIGTGTGIVAIFCALNGSRKIVATDINPQAIKNTQLNSQQYNLNIDVRQGNLFRPIKFNEKFDFIFWNHPFNNWGENVNDILLKAGFDTNYRYLKNYIKNAHKHLKSKGRLLLGTGNFADIDEIKKIAQKNNYKIVLLANEKLPITTKGIKNEYYIYEFKKHPNL